MRLGTAAERAAPRGPRGERLPRAPTRRPGADEVSSGESQPLEMGALPPNPQSFPRHGGIALVVKEMVGWEA
jgi:hypothetical protein